MRILLFPPLFKMKIVFVLVVMNMISGLKIANPETRPPSSRNSTSALYSRDLKNKFKSRDQVGAIGFGIVKSLQVGPVAVLCE